MEQRARLLQAGQEGTGPVIYWMSREQRADDNWPLLFAQQKALERQAPLLVVFYLAPAFLGATLRQYDFMLRGLAETEARLREKQISFTVVTGDIKDLIRYFVSVAARLVVTDFDPLKIKQAWLREATDGLAVPLYQVDGHNVIPCWLASAKAEYGAYTIRPKLHRLLSAFLTDFPSLKEHPYVSDKELPLTDWTQLRKFLRLDLAVGAVKLLPGSQAGRKVMGHFLQEKLKAYEQDRNNPLQEGQSGLSPYFHFGQIAPQRAAWEALQSGSGASVEGFLEELIVRRELADNFCYYQENYDSTVAFPNWAKATLAEHQSDVRPYLYSLEALAAAATHDPLWNRMQSDLVATGHLHGYLRMYWAKKLLEWTTSPEEALYFGTYLNDKYALDGRDPNGYAGLAWSIGGVHDRAFANRAIFGKIRYMSEGGLKRKFNIKAYIGRQVSLL